MLRAGFGEGMRSCCADSQPDAPHESPPVHQPESSLSPVLLGFYGGFIMHVWLTKLLAVEDRMPPLVPLPSPEAREWDWSSNPLISWLIFLATSPHAHLLSQCHLIHITKDTVIALTLISQEIPKVLAAPCQEQWMKNKYLSLIIKHILIEHPLCTGHSFRSQRPKPLKNTRGLFSGIVPSNEWRQKINKLLC